MAAAYAALVSVMHIIDQIHHHPRPPISLDNEQVESLTEKITFLQQFLEGYSHVGYSRDADPLESRIADAAYAAEDVIESYIVDQILTGSMSHGEKISSVDFYEGLQKVVEDMDSIKKEVMEIKKKTGVQDLLIRNSTSVGSLRSSSSSGQNTMVGFDDVLLEIMDKLTGGQLDRQVIPIVGMGGIGKTTLARNIYEKPLIKEYFDICAWATISQEYRMGEILLELLQEGERNLSQMNEYELGDKLHKRLSGRRYLIIMDDIWDIEVWEQLQFFFPDNHNGSRIMLTTRLSNLASYVPNSHGISMAFLNEDNSWNLFSKTVFGEEGCPLELQEIGKKIVKNCKGLPLSIVVIGGLLAKCNHTREYWEYIATNLISVVNSEDNDSCLKVLHVSYNQLPIHLKPCFLYMGVFKEDSVIRVPMLIKLWVAEGFLKPISGKSLEETAKDYLKELINRNLILVHELGCTGSTKCCNIHDLVRDLCLREAQKERFYNVTRQHSDIDLIQSVNTQRRIIISKSTSEEKVLDIWQSMSLARSLICNIEGVLPSLNFRLLRVLETWPENLYPVKGMHFLENIFQLVNSRYLDVRAHQDSEFSSSVYLLWNLQTLIVDGYSSPKTAPAEIWKMPQLKHVEFRGGLYLPNPPSGDIDRGDDIVLENLQTLSEVHDFNCGEEVIKRIPNIKKLRMFCTEDMESHLNNLNRLHKLESLRCSSSPASWPNRSTDILQNLTFPNSLKKLTLEAYHTHLEDMLEKIGSLPCLEKLQLFDVSFQGHKWESTVEGQFRSLKFLKIGPCDDLEYWTTESGSFPRLEHLVLDSLPMLKGIPSEIGENQTLQSIDLQFCSSSAVISAKKILMEQEEFGNEDLQVRVILWPGKNEALQSLEGPNFHVIAAVFG